MHKKTNRNHNLTLLAMSLVVGLIMLIYNTCLEIKKGQTTETQNILNYSVSKIENSFIDTTQHTEYIMRMLNNQIARNPNDLKYIYSVISKFKIDNRNDGALPWTVFSWANEKHKITVDAASGIIKPFDLSIRDYIPATISKPNVLHMGHPVFGSTTNKWILPGGVGYVDEKNKYIGASVIGFDLNLMNAVLVKKIKNTDISFIITDNKNNLLIDSSKFVQGPPTEGEDIAPEIKNYASKGKTKPFYSVSITGNKDSYIIKQIPGYPFNIMVRYSATAVSHAFAESMLANLTKIIFIITLFLFIGYLIYREKKLKWTTQKLHRQTLKQSKAKNEFLAYTGHELRSPLNGILFASEMIIKKMFGEMHPKYYEYVKDIHQNGIELLHFIEDLIDVTRADQGSFSLRAEKINIEECVKRVVNLNSARAAKSGIKIISYIEKDIPDLYADPQRLRQILNNLVSNAVKYSANNTFVKIIIHSIDDVTQIIVEDQGFGMTPEQLKVALSKYGTIDNENTGKVDSIGLGLPLVKNLVEAHKAKFEIESEKDVGTKVTITFPVHKVVKTEDDANSSKIIEMKPPAKKA